MWTYEKRLQYPINITKPNAKIAKVIMSQFGGPDGELGASTRYLSQRYSNTNKKVCGVLTDIGVSVTKLPRVSAFYVAIFCKV
ncbi:MAG: manganese catalase family protein [Eubacterium sp.]|nr:manganese catalase family protein [Eubacterium sp.]